MQKALMSQLLAECCLCRIGGEALLALSHAVVPVAGDDPPQPCSSNFHMPQTSSASHKSVKMQWHTPPCKSQHQHSQFPSHCNLFHFFSQNHHFISASASSCCLTFQLFASCCNQTSKALRKGNLLLSPSWLYPPPASSNLPESGVNNPVPLPQPVAGGQKEGKRGKMHTQHLIKPGWAPFCSVDGFFFHWFF